MRRSLVKAALLGGMGAWLTISPVWAQSPSFNEVAFAFAIADGTLPPAQRLIQVRKGDTLRWRISSNRTGELHLHAYRLSVHLQAGQTQDLIFEAFATGRFRLEWHGEHDKGKPGANHHAPPLALLEVLPR